MGRHYYHYQYPFCERGRDKHD